MLAVGYQNLPFAKLTVRDIALGYSFLVKASGFCTT